MNAQPKLILVVEDDAATRSMLRAVLEEDGHRVLESDGAAVGLHLFRTRKPDLAVLDVNLPDGDGMDLCRKMRSSPAQGSVPVIMLTAKSGMEDKLSGFDAGADQYLTKPICAKEFLMWVRALLRRVGLDKEEGPQLRCGDLIVDSKARIVAFKGQAIANLTGKEFDLIYHLVKKRPQVLSRKFILASLWHTVASEHLVDTHISNLRKKLPPEVSNRIQNVSGVGFRFFE
jgi:DNA-binding response OmpR family regulator